MFFFRQIFEANFDTQETSQESRRASSGLLFVKQVQRSPATVALSQCCVEHAQEMPPEAKKVLGNDGNLESYVENDNWGQTYINNMLIRQATAAVADPNEQFGCK